MTREETAGILAILAEMWTTQPITEQTVKAYHFVWEDVPAELILGAAKVWMRSDNAFWPRAGQLRTLALERGVGVPAAELAWDEVRRAIASVGMYGAPVWSNAIIERTVQTLGWRSLCVADESDIGTTRAQFRETYKRLAEAMVSGEAAPALAEAAERRAALERARRPAVPYLRPVAALPASADAASAPGVPFALARARRRFEERNPEKVATPKEPSDAAALLRRITATEGWAALPEERRREQLARFLAGHPECAGLPELAGLEPTAELAMPALGSIIVDALPRRKALTALQGGAVVAVTYEASNPLVLGTPEQCIEAFRESGIDRAPLTQRWHPDTTHIFAEWARRRGHDAVCLQESAFAGELGYEWVAGTFGEPQMILLEPAKARIHAPLPPSG